MEPLRLSFLSRSVEKTRRLGAALGELLLPGDFVALLGELGAGKTEFVRGVAEGAGVPAGEVASPTFALIYHYQGRVPLVHADLFRLQTQDDLYGTGYFELRDRGEAALLVEWADRIPHAVPPDALEVRLTAGVGKERRLAAVSSGPLSQVRLAAWGQAAADAASH